MDARSSIEDDDAYPLARKLENAVDLSESDRQVLRSLGSDRRRIGKGADIIGDGDTPKGVQLILKGWACRYKMLPSGNRQITAILLPGDFCDLHVTMLKAMDHGIAALSPVVVARMSRTQIDAAVHDRRNIALAFEWASMVDVGTLRAWITSIGQGSAVSRIAHLLCELHQRLAMIGLTDGNSFSTELTQIDVSSITGLTPVHVNRVVGHLRDRKLVVMKRKQVVIEDMETLRRVADFDPSYLHTQKLTHR